MANNSRRLDTPYSSNSNFLQNSLNDSEVNSREHNIYWPRLEAMLPRTASRVLDFGCGSGYFTEKIATMYPEAEIIAVDREASMLPINNGRVTYEQWDGLTPLGKDGFDLIIAKMSLHYLSDDNLRALAQNLIQLMDKGAKVVFSVPNPVDSALYNDMKRHEWSRRNAPGMITREIGSTGITASMFHRNIADWMNWIWRPMKKAYPELRYTVVVDDDICDETGKPKRLDIMVVPAYDPEHTLAYERIEKIAGPFVEQVIKVDPSSKRGRELLYGEIFEPPKPLP